MAETRTRIKCDRCGGTGRLNYWLGMCRGCNGSGRIYLPNCMCPACGSMVYPYGRTWMCAAAYCCHTETGICGRMPDGNGPDLPWWSDGTKVYKDGDAWCATHEDFANLQESLAGFGRSPEDAIAALKLAEGVEHG